MYTKMFIVLNNSVSLIDSSHSLLVWKPGLRQPYNSKLMAVYYCRKEWNCFFNSIELILQNTKSTDLYFSTHPMSCYAKKKQDIQESVLSPARLWTSYQQKQSQTLTQDLSGEQK